ncbi:hypothetical protein D3C75_742040 [compost metagenome]
MGTEGACVGNAVPFHRTGPALRRTADDHRPQGTGGMVVFTGILLNGLDFLNDSIQHLGHFRMHQIRVGAFHIMRLPAHTGEVSGHFLTGLTGKDGGIADFEAVQVKNRQYCAVGDRIDEPVGEPGCGQRSGFGFAVSDDNSGDQLRFVENSADTMGEGITQLAAFMDGARSFGSGMGGDSAREGELLEELDQTGNIPGNFRIDFGVAAVQVRVGNHDLAAVAGAFDVEHIQIILGDGPVQVGIDKVLAWDGAPVADGLYLHMGILQRFLQQRVAFQVELAYGNIVGCAPIGVKLIQIRLGGVIQNFGSQCHYVHSYRNFSFCLGRDCKLRGEQILANFRSRQGTFTQAYRGYVK